jgi:arylsulfatase A-like enzyme
MFNWRLIRPIIVSTCILTGLCITPLFAAPPASTQPNIILIMVDDLGFSDIGCYGSEINTPHLDQLAAEGMRFTQFYNGARCCPTRASLLTGLFPHQAGIGHMTSENDPTLRRNDIISNPAYQGYLNRNCVTIAEALKPAGYQTFMTGKWHVGTYRPNWPVDRGFDRYFGVIRGASNYFKPEPDKLLLHQDKVFTPPDDFYTTDYFSKYAAQFIEEADRDQPFFLYVAYNAPHWPLQAWPEDIDKYRGRYKIGWDKIREQRFAKQKSMGLFSDDVQLSPRNPEAPAWNDAENKDDWDLRMAVYAAMVDRVDQGIGNILDVLEAAGETENTLIMFLTDNGGCAEPYNPKPNIDPGPVQSNTGYFLPWANASNTPFRLFKHWTHEGGISSPFIVSWPATIPKPNTITDEPAHINDIMATCLDIAQADYPVKRGNYDIVPFAGKSLFPVFNGSDSPLHEALYWEHEGNRAIRKGPWKLVSYYNAPRQKSVGTGLRTGPWELYNIDEDRTELHDLAKQHTAKVRAMADEWDAWAESSNVMDWEIIQHKLEQAKK